VAAATEKVPGEVKRELVGPDVVDGRAVTKYRVVFTARAGEGSVLQWVDDASKIPLKTSAEDGSWSMEYKNLRIEQQDASLFEVPAGYKKFAMPNMAAMMRGAQQQKNAGEYR